VSVPCSIDYIQLQEGSIATPYEPYQESTATIDLQGHELASLPDGTKDVLNIYRDGRVELVKNTSKLSLAIADMDNSDSFPGWKTSGIRAILGANVDKSYATGALINIAGTTANKFAVNTKFSNDVIYLPRATYGLTQTQWLEQYPNLIVQMIFALSEPQTIQLPSITTPTPIDGGTMRIVANVIPEIDVSYVANGMRGGILALNNCADDLAALDVRVTALENELDSYQGN
jgi:hypothetical protein